MDLLTVAVLGVLVVVLATTVAPRLGVASPLLLVLLGIGVSFLPMMEPFQLDPKWILGVILPPLLYTVAVRTPTREFRRNLPTISVFAVLLVVVSAVGVGFLLTWLMPGLPLAVGIAIGAVVSPTDAVATVIVRKAGVSPRIVTVLEGEALFNDASALVLLRSAVAAFATTVSFSEVVLDFLYAVAVALIVGYVVGRVNIAIRSRIPQTSANVAFSLVIPFLAYVPAEHLHASGLVAAVVAGLVTGYHHPKYIAAKVRFAEDGVWKTIELLLESAVFLLMGLQFKALLEDVYDLKHSVWTALLLGIATTTVVMLVRSVFVAGSVGMLARRAKKTPERREAYQAWQERLDTAPLTRDGQPISQKRMNRIQTFITRHLADLDYLANEQFGRKDGVILIAAGMRGVVTLAAAQSLPLNTTNRSLLILVAFFVAAGTLIVQGFSLSYLVRWLKPKSRDPQEEARLLAELRAELAHAALADLEGRGWKREDGSSCSAETVAEVHQVLEGKTIPEAALSGFAEELAELRSVVLDAERTALLRLRDLGTYPSEVLDTRLAQFEADQLSIELRQQ